MPANNELGGWQWWPVLRAGLLGLLHAMASLALLWSAQHTRAACITEPIMGGADPAVIYTNGFFYSLRTTGGDVRIRRSTTLAGMASGTEVTVFTPNADIRSDIWAPGRTTFDQALAIFPDDSPARAPLLAAWETNTAAMLQRLGEFAESGEKAE